MECYNPDEMPAAIIWTDELVEAICNQLIEGKSMRQICAQEGFPDRITVIRHMRNSDEFATKCARARDEQADLMDDRILEVAQKVEDGALEPKAGSVVISALQWRASKLKPKKYGDKLQTELSGEVSFVSKSILDKE